MKFNAGSLLPFLPYIGLFAALILSAWTFFRSEQYRHDTDEVLSQTFEIQWRATQVRERLLRVSSYIRLANETGKLDPDINRQIALVHVNVEQLRALSYAERLLPDKDIKLLDNVRQVIADKIAPIVVARTNYDQALAHMTELDRACSRYPVAASIIAQPSKS